MVDLVLSLVLATTVIALGVWGAIVSVESLPAGGNKPRHFWGIVGLGTVATVLTAVIGIKTSYEQKEAATQQRQLSASLQNAVEQIGQSKSLLMQSRLSEEFIKGQISGLSLSLGKVDRDGGASSAFGKALLAISQVGKSSTPSSAQTSPHDISNQELRSRAMAMAQAIDGIEQAYEHGSRLDPRSPEYERLSGAAHEQELQQWNPLRAETRLLIDEMKVRVPPERYPKDTYLDVPMAVDDGRLSGAYPLRNVEEYLRRLAVELPQSVKP